MRNCTFALSRREKRGYVKRAMRAYTVVAQAGNVRSLRLEVRSEASGVVFSGSQGPASSRVTRRLVHSRPKAQCNSDEVARDNDGPTTFNNDVFAKRRDLAVDGRHNRR